MSAAMDNWLAAYDVLGGLLHLLAVAQSDSGLQAGPHAESLPRSLPLHPPTASCTGRAGEMVAPVADAISETGSPSSELQAWGSVAGKLPSRKGPGGCNSQANE